MSDELPYVPGKRFEALPYLGGELPIKSYVSRDLVVRDPMADEACRRIRGGETSFEIKSVSLDGNTRRVFRFRASK